MSTILTSDETGTLHLPAALLPQPGPHRQYRVETENGQVIVNEVSTEKAGAWMELAGCMSGEKEELRRIERVITEEFGRVNPADWQ